MNETHYISTMNTALSLPSEINVAHSVMAQQPLDVGVCMMLLGMCVCVCWQMGDWTLLVYSRNYVII